MQLCLLLLPQASRARLHTVTRLIHDAAHNKELILSRSKTNFDEVVTLPSPYWWRMSDVIYYCLQSMLLSLVPSPYHHHPYLHLLYVYWSPDSCQDVACASPIGEGEETPPGVQCIWHLIKCSDHPSGSYLYRVVITPVEATYTV